MLRIKFLVNSFINFELKARKIHEYMDRLLIIYIFNKTIYFFVSIFGTNIGSVKVPYNYSILAIGTRLINCVFMNVCVQQKQKEERRGLEDITQQ